jgi:putative ABC transport system substrate-binding protein
MMLVSKYTFVIWYAIAMCVLLFAVSSFAAVRQSEKIMRIGTVDASTASGRRVLWDSFRQELSKLSWIEGTNYAIESRFGENKVDRVLQLATELVRLKVDVMVTSGGESALAAKQATASIPIVMAVAPDPVASGLIASLSHPGGNITGLSSQAPDLNTKSLELIKEMVPNVTRIGVMVPGSGIANDLQLKPLRSAALALNLKLFEIDTQTNAKGLESAFQAAKLKQVQVFMALANPQIFGERQRIIELARKNRLPAMYFDKGFAVAGGLMSYGIDVSELFRSAAHYVDKILKGACPAEMPVQQATKIELVINLKAAKEIGLTIPVRMLERANEVIK